MFVPKWIHIHQLESVQFILCEPSICARHHSGLWDLSASRKAFCQQPTKSDLREHRDCSPGALEILEWLGQTTATVNSNIDLGLHNKWNCSRSLKGWWGKGIQAEGPSRAKAWRCDSMGLLMGGPSPSDCEGPCVPGRVDHISSCESLFAQHSPIQIPPVVCLIFFL